MSLCLTRTVHIPIITQFCGEGYDDLQNGERMRFNVVRLLKGTVGIQKSYTFDAPSALGEDTPVNHVKGSLRLMRTDAGVWVNGTLDVSSGATCSRCLEESTVELRLQMDDVYYPTVDVNTGAMVRLPEDGESSCIIDAQHVLDITEAVRQYTAVGLPMKPLCDPGCAGLCSRCGTNLNHESCSCETWEIDSRWLPLVSLTSSTPESSRS